MRIGLDLSSATPTRTGIGTYTYELARRLVRSTAHEWVLLFNSLRQPLPDAPEWHASHVRVVRRRIPGPLLLKGWQFLNFPDVEALAGGSVDLFHSPATFIPAQRRGIRATTVHDLYFLEPDARRAPLGGAYLKWVVENRLSSMDLIITDAPSVARQVEALVHRCPARGKGSPRVVSIPLGVDESYFAFPGAERLEAVRREYALPERFLLHVGGNDPRKNVPRLLEAFRTVADPTLSLVLAGSAGVEGGERVMALPYLSADTLRALYHLAVALVFPSLHEGFGFPVLEAMACGTPVVASNQVAVLECLPQGIVAQCEASSSQSIASAVADLLADGHRRKEMAEAGRTVASQFTWEQTARLTCEAYQAAGAVL